MLRWWGTEWKGSSVCTFQRQKSNMPYTKKQEVAIQGYYFTILELITEHTVQVKAEGERCSRELPAGFTRLAHLATSLNCVHVYSIKRGI